MSAAVVDTALANLHYAYVNLYGQHVEVVLREGGALTGVMRAYDTATGDVYLEFAEKKVRRAGPRRGTWRACSWRSPARACTASCARARTSTRSSAC